jgi:hypothetical protein
LQLLSFAWPRTLLHLSSNSFRRLPLYWFLSYYRYLSQILRHLPQSAQCLCSVGATRLPAKRKPDTCGRGTSPRSRLCLEMAGKNFSRRQSGDEPALRRKDSGHRSRSPSRSRSPGRDRDYRGRNAFAERGPDRERNRPSNSKPPLPRLSTSHVLASGPPVTSALPPTTPTEPKAERQPQLMRSSPPTVSATSEIHPARAALMEQAANQQPAAEAGASRRGSGDDDVAMDNGR